jgi:TetR/AcrR family fatty acid metabolism transcriptional regulator
MPRTSAATKELRRAQIMQAALRCFARTGFHATTMDDVAAEAGVSKGTPYLYFTSKAELYRALYEWWSCGLSDRVDAAIKALPEQARHSPRRTLLAVLAAIGEHVATEPDACRVLLEAMAQARHVPGIAESAAASQAQTLDGLEQLLGAGVSAGEWHLAGGAALHARLLLAAIYGLMTQWHLEPGSFSWSEAASAMVEQLASGRVP